MGYLARGISAAGGRRIIVSLGGMYVALAAGFTLMQMTGGTPFSVGLSRFLLIVIPGGILVYCGHRLPQTDIHEGLYSFVTWWVLIGVGVMLGVIGVIELIGGLENPVFSVLLATALGSVGGFGIGQYAAQAKTRAREAEQYSLALEQANDQLESQQQQLESFAGMLAHELRNPLQIAKIYHQQERHADEEAADQVTTAHDRIEEMIDVLLITVRGTGESTDVEAVRLADVIADAWETVTSDGVSGNLVVETEQAIRTDPTHLQYLFRQLFRNSLEAGGENVTVRVGELEDSDGFYIEDDGPGIPEDVRDAVTTAGFSTKPGGQGLGLTFVAQLAEAYDWEWRITESEFDGARINFMDVNPALSKEQEELRRN
jgi:signal transduction histidine kinase